VRCCIQASAVGSARSHVDAHASPKKAPIPPVSAVADVALDARIRLQTPPEGPGSRVRERDLAKGTEAREQDLRGTVDGIRVVLNDGRVRLSADGRPVGESRIGWPFTSGWAAKVGGGVLVGAAVNIGDGCGAWVYDDVVWIPLSPAAR
jgi:hypothetical protein